MPSQPVDLHVQAVEVVGPIERELGIAAAQRPLPDGAVVVGVGAQLSRGFDDQFVGVCGDVSLGSEQIDRMA